MTNQKTTKKALLSSVLSLVLCLTMLIGTTFAWFTDSVTSTNNIIKSGNLDVELEYSTNMTDWNKVTETTNIFKEGALWEPGYTEVVYLRVSNLGSLALKYNLGVNVASEIEGTNKAGENFKLSNYIEFGVIDPVDEKFANRDAARAAVTNAKKLSAGYTKEGSLLAKAENASDYPSSVVAMVVYMPETVGNEANHNGNAPEIKLGLNLLATQYTAEEDSFDKYYDEDAIYYDVKVSNASDLAAAINAGEEIIAIDGNIALTSSLNASGVTFVGLGAGATIDFGTQGISGSDITYKNLTLDNDRDGWYEGMEYGNAANNTYVDCTFVNGVTTYGNSTFKNCTFNELPTGEYALFIYGGKNITVDGCTFNYGNRAIKIYNEGYTPNVTVSVSNTAFKASETTVANKAMIEIDDQYMSSINVTVKDITVDAAIAAQGVYRIDDGALDTSTDKSKVSVDGVVATAVAANQDELKAAIATGTDVAVELGEGNYTLPAVSNKEVTISGTKDTVITVDKPAYHGSDLTLEGVTVAGSGYATGVQHVNTVTYKDVTIKGEMCLYGEEVSFTNCTFELAKGQYLWTYGAKKVTFEGCTFNTAGKAILIYNEDANLVCDVTVKNCTFNATEADYAGTILNQACAAIEIGSNLSKSGHYTLTTSGNTVDSDFSGEWRIKASAGDNVTVNEVDYEAVTLDGVGYTLSGTTVTEK